MYERLVKRTIVKPLIAWIAQRLFCQYRGGEIITMLKKFSIVADPVECILLDVIYYSLTAIVEKWPLRKKIRCQSNLHPICAPC